VNLESIRSSIIQSHVLLFGIVSGVILTTQAAAGLPHPRCWTSISDDGRFIFVMLSPLTFGEETSHPSFDQYDIAASREIREKYQKSGLYRNDGSRQLLWEYTEEWHARPVIVAPDGEHLIFPGDWTHDEYGIRVVEFTRRGQLVRQYRDYEIIPQYLFKSILNGLSCPTCSGTWFDPANMTYGVSTNQNEKIIFDVRTGELVARHSPFPMYYAAAGAVAMLLVVALIAHRRRRRIERATG